MADKINCPFCDKNITLSDLREACCSGCGATISENSKGEVCFAPAGDSFSKGDERVGLNVEIKKTATPPEIKKNVQPPKPVGNLAQRAKEYGLTVSAATLVAADLTMENVIIPEGVGIIEKRVFEKSRVKSITIPSSVYIIEENAFSSCYSLENVYFGGTIEQWCKMQFKGLWSNPLCQHANLYIGGELLKFLVIPSGVKKLSQYAFFGCKSIETVYLPTGLTEIPSSAFWQCKSLHSVNIPETVTSIGGLAFAECPRLSSITIPKSVKYIGWCPFAACYPAISITVQKSKSQTSSWSKEWNAISTTRGLFGYKKYKVTYYG